MDQYNTKFLVIPCTDSFVKTLTKFQEHASRFQAAFRPYENVQTAFKKNPKYVNSSLTGS